MSRAFVKEDNGDHPENLPARPVSPLPNYMTPAGHRAMRKQLNELEREKAALKGSEELSQKSRQAHLERDIRYFLSRLRVAQLVPLLVKPPKQVVFGCTVTFADAEDIEYHYQIVGEDEADVKQHKISWASPLARALVNQPVGEVVVWPKPAGAIEVEIIRITIASECL